MIPVTTDMQPAPLRLYNPAVQRDAVVVQIMALTAPWPVVHYSNVTLPSENDSDRE